MPPCRSIQRDQAGSGPLLDARRTTASIRPQRSVDLRRGPQVGPWVFATQSDLDLPGPAAPAPAATTADYLAALRKLAPKVGLRGIIIDDGHGIGAGRTRTRDCSPTSSRGIITGLPATIVLVGTGFDESGSAARSLRVTKSGSAAPDGSMSDMGSRRHRRRSGTGSTSAQPQRSPHPPQRAARIRLTTRGPSCPPRRQRPPPVWRWSGPNAPRRMPCGTTPTSTPSLSRRRDPGSRESEGR
jgi:hypothetical protein